MTSLYSSVLARGATLQVLGDGTLEVDGTELLGDALMAQLKAHKPEIMALVRQQNGHHANGHSTAELPARGPPQAMPRPPSVESAVTAEAAVLAHKTWIPDIFFDWVAPELSEGELRVMIYLLRRTLGFHKTADHISLSQFTDGLKTRDGRRLDAGTKVDRKTVTRAIDGLVKRELIVCERADAGAPGRPTNCYRLNFEAFTKYLEGQS